MKYIVIVSFLLDSIISNFVGIHSNICIPLFTLTSLVIIFTYYNREKEYFKLCLFIGILYDIVFTNTLFINAGLFLIVGFITKILNYYLSNNVINNTIMLIINIFVYRFIMFSILVLANITNFDFFLFFESFYSSLLLNIIYSVIIYLTLEKKLANKYKYYL